jgi:hypothetical protein
VLWRKVFASKSYHSGHKEAVIASDSHCSGNILAIIAFYSLLNKQCVLVNKNK